LEAFTTQDPIAYNRGWGFEDGRVWNDNVPITVSARDRSVTRFDRIPAHLVASALYRLVEPRGMRVKFDRDTCVGMYQCVAEWDAFEKNLNDGKADLRGSEEEDEDVFVVEVPDGEEFDAKFAARVCPVDAIEVYDDDGEQVV
jgi:Ferredoxin